VLGSEFITAAEDTAVSSAGEVLAVDLETILT
jgi:hypothetical protein